MTRFAPGWVRSQGSGRRHTGEQGASAVEFALVLPVLVLILGGIVDFGFVFSQQIAFNTAARDAARAGVVSSISGAGLTCQQVASRARDNAQQGAVGVPASSAADIAVTVTGAGGTCSLPAGSTSVTGAATSSPCSGSAASGAMKDLQVSLSYASTPPFPVPFMGTLNLSSRGNFQCEYS